MAHYAFIDENNIVTQVIVGRDEDDLAEGVTSWEEYYGEFHGQTCLRTSYNTVGNQHNEGGIPFRGNYAAIGYTYDPERDAFIPPADYPSWILNEDTFLWEPPAPRPAEGDWEWDEETTSWVEVTE